jgi:conjugal transfer/entry exclusion protein
MGFEPNARRRLRLVASAARDPVLAHELVGALEEETMSQVPSVDLARAIARCPHCRSSLTEVSSRDGLCEVHRARWNLESCLQDSGSEREIMSTQRLESLLRSALTSEEGGTQFLAAYERQARALDAVWEAHRRGAVQLPQAVADKVEQARTTPPRFLRGGTFDTMRAR